MNANFTRRLAAMGFDSYEAYLDSPRWTEFRAAYYSAGRPASCAVCRCSNVTLHHRTYERLGAERFDDVVPLCWTHHKAVHSWLERSRLPVEATARAVNALRLRTRSRKGRGQGKGRFGYRRVL